MRNLAGIVFMATLLTLVVLGAAGCASTPQATPERDAEAKQFGSSPAAATVYIYRPGGSAELQDDPVLWIDDRLIGATLPRAYFRVHLDPGNHVFTGLGPDNGRLTLETRPGEVYFVEQVVSGGQSRFRLVTAQLWQQVITNCCHLLETWAPGQRPLLR